MQLQPGEKFIIARGLEDHTDSTTYYVRAVVRNAKTDVLIKTIDLVDRGDGHRFSNEFEVPQDTIGLGYYIIVTTSVYTDSGYTTKSPLYGDKYETYLVQQRMNPNTDVTAHFDTPDVDYKKIRQIIKEEMKAEPIDLSPVLNALNGLKTAIKAIKVDNITPVDLSPVMAEIKRTQESVSKIKPAEVKIKEPDMKPVFVAVSDEFEQIKAANNIALQEMKESLTSVVDTAFEQTRQLIDRIDTGKQKEVRKKEREELQKMLSTVAGDLKDPEEVEQDPDTVLKEYVNA